MIHGHADGGEQENKSMETGRGGAKHAEAAGGRERHTTQKVYLCLTDETLPDQG